MLPLADFDRADCVTHCIWFTTRQGFDTSADALVRFSKINEWAKLPYGATSWLVGLGASQEFSSLLSRVTDTQTRC